MLPSVPANPYYYASPVRAISDFFGRERQLWDIFESVRKRSCTSIVGERRSGKTSLLLHMLHPEVRERYIPGERNTLYVALDTEIIPRDPEGFFREMFREVKVQGPDLPIFLDESPVNEQRVRLWLDAMAGYHLVLLVDEFEGISMSESFPPRFFDFLRGLCTHYSLSLVLATRRRLSDCCPQETVTSGFHNIFKPVEVGAFVPAEVDEFIQATSAPSGIPLWEWRAEIIKMAGHYPYLLQMACYHCFNLWVERGELNMDVFPMVRRRFEHDARPYFGAVWNRYLSSEERAALALLARGEPGADPNAVWGLEEKGYLSEGQLLSEIFADYVRQQPVSDESLAFAGAPVLEIASPKGLWLDKASGNVYLGGKSLDPPLTKHQYRLLELLWDYRGRICDPYVIVQAVWGEDYPQGIDASRVIEDVDDQRIAQLITRLRKRIELEGKPWKYIITVHGRGLTLGNGEPVDDQ
jgi:DNA-binding winged helix-turn-helix (wHTH) protein